MFHTEIYFTQYVALNTISLYLLIFNNTFFFIKNNNNKHESGKEMCGPEMPNYTLAPSHGYN